ncbi:tRNAHis guanylyltransferase-domain-containing protein [Dendryphion nanum]|uniref:tRNA(His) guanylyltransferase n=1 Tax=Dendryphion nanum TaxID=256645 RepID=A0A9P9EF44_9PLEO|nr:tRNAHis guanylyltransferase-domain-containing protein [Dendryphion nanum]
MSSKGKEGVSTPQADTLADRMKTYEAPFEYTLPANSPVILRLDGHRFSRFTKHFDRPFDQRIHNAMVATSSDLLKYFPSATVAYTQSDEITLVFPNGVQSFNDRVQKLASLASSYCSVRFGGHLRNFLAETPEPKVEESTFEDITFAHFDARWYAVPSVEEALNVLLWRCRGDAVRNAITAFARTLYSTQEMHKKHYNQLLEMMKTEKGVQFEESVPKWALQGCLLKREQFEHQGHNPKTGLREATLRVRTRVEYRGVTEFNDKNLRLVTDKYW